eukprot:Clim_evm53s134 gene=Clim_evmTU53s134
MSKSTKSAKDQVLGRNRTDIALSSFAFLFAEIVQYCRVRVDSIPELERKLSEIGYRVGVRVIELFHVRDKGQKRETRILNELYFIQSTLWRILFGKQAEYLEKENSKGDDTYLITDSDLIVNRFIDLPADFGSLNCGAFVAGIVEAVLDGAHFPARVTAHSTEKGTTILIKFSASVMARERYLESR